MLILFSHLHLGRPSSIFLLGFVIKFWIHVWSSRASYTPCLRNPSFLRPWRIRVIRLLLQFALLTVILLPYVLYSVIFKLESRFLAWLALRTWRWKRYGPPKRWYIFYLRGVTIQNVTLWQPHTLLDACHICQPLLCPPRSA
jgi:hypothetical protein